LKEHEIRKLNTLKKNEYKKLADKNKNIAMLERISSGLDYQKHLMVNNKLKL